MHYKPADILKNPIRPEPSSGRVIPLCGITDISNNAHLRWISCLERELPVICLNDRRDPEDDNKRSRR